MLAAVLAVLAVGSLGSPQRAEAIDVTYGCKSIVWNGTPTDVNIRLIPPTWVPFPGTPMLPVSGTPAAVLSVYVAVGVPQRQMGNLLDHTGAFITGGCAATVSYATGQGALVCEYHNWVRGPSDASCSGPIAAYLFPSTNPLLVEFHVGSRRPYRSASAVPASSVSAAQVKANAKPPSHPDSAKLGLKSQDLPGGGWDGTKDITQLGVLGELLMRGHEPESCTDSGKPDELGSKFDHSLFTRNGGAQSAFSIVEIFKRDQHAAGAWNNGLTPAEADCLASVLTVSDERFQTTATAAKLPLRRAEVRNRGFRITVDGTVDGSPWSGHIDLAELRHDEKWAIVGSFRESATPPLHSVRTFRSIAERIASG